MIYGDQSFLSLLASSGLTGVSLGLPR